MNQRFEEQTSDNLQRFAVIDMGSNSVRLMLSKVKNGQLIEAEKHLAMTRLGAGVDATQTLSEASMLATIEALKVFSEKAKVYGAQMIGAFATSAVRDALNGEAFAKRATAATGVNVSIIPGDKEALLGYLGVMGGLTPELRSERFIIIDIGGGSTELIVGTAEGIDYRFSFNVGTVRMTGKHITTDPIAIEEDEKLKSDVVAILSEGVKEALSYKPSQAIGIGGTATTFGAMMLHMATYDRDQVHNAFVSVRTLRSQVATLKQATILEKSKMAGLMPKRADVIYAGGVILLHLLEALNLEGFYVSDYDNLEGIMVELGHLSR